MCLGIPGRIVATVDGNARMAIVDIGGVRRPINISFIATDGRASDAYIGEWVLVHVGFAMSRIDEQEAARTLALLHELGEAQAEIEAMRQSLPPAGQAVS
jgi:hydrogenase expression/formation protein HypC